MAGAKNNHYTLINVLNQKLVTYTGPNLIKGSVKRTLINLGIVTMGRSIINMPLEGGNVFYLRSSAVTLAKVISGGGGRGGT